MNWFWFFRVFIILFFSYFSLPSFAQKNGSEFSLTIVVKDSLTKEKMEAATIIIQRTNQTKKHGILTDKDGIAHCQLQAGEYRVDITFVGYHSTHLQLELSSNKTLYALLSPSTTGLNDIIVTASESKGITSSSRIGRDALNLIQPTGFSDILSLLPGGKAQAPIVGSVNLINLREVGISGSDYDISSLGTAFLIDGNTISGNANMQYVPGSWESDISNRNSVAGGIDMRTISTDEIEHVEIIRGIPSVEYGDLTSGVVRIERKRGYYPWSARFKADPKGELFAVGKGWNFDKQKTTLNIGIDYLDSKVDPRDRLENYKRITASVRIGKEWQKEHSKLTWHINTDYTGSFDNVKQDPDINKQKVDRFKSTYNKIGISSNLIWASKTDHLLRRFNLNASINYVKDKIIREKFVQLSRDTPTPTNREEGEFDATPLPYSYVGHLKVDGEPLYLSLKTTAYWQIIEGNFSHDIKTGAEWNLDKNLGDGQVFDPLTPVYPEMNSRARAYKDIPAGETFSLFVEDNINLLLGSHRINIVAGIRGMTRLNLSKEYSMRGKIYFDPRINLLWELPTHMINNDLPEIYIAGGFGWHTRMPVMTQLYPELLYVDKLQLNYYHENQEYRRINQRTYIIDPTNYKLKPANNFKWEVRVGMNYKDNDLSITYFNEKLTDGFRNGSNYRSLAYKKYSTKNIDGNSLQAPPDLQDLTYEDKVETTLYSMVTNGSALYKEGIEYTYRSQRIESIKTRITINGAWFKSTYKNSQPVYRRPSIVINDERYKYIGEYITDEGYVKQQFNTNFMFDTYIPLLGLSFATTVESTWFTNNRRMKKNGIPAQYVDEYGNKYPYTLENQGDTYLQHLIERYSDLLFKKQTVPFGMNINLKATKRFGNYARLALFVNNLLDYYPDYKLNNHTVRRTVSPYFGMELNFTI